MTETQELEFNTELANELVKPILKTIDNYFFINFEDIQGNKGLMIPYDDKIKQFEKVTKGLQDRSSHIDSMACIIGAFGKDCIREGQKAREIADISEAILNLAKIRTEQVKNALDYAKTEQNREDLFKSLGI